MTNQPNFDDAFSLLTVCSVFMIVFQRALRLSSVKNIHFLFQFTSLIRNGKRTAMQ